MLQEKTKRNDHCEEEFNVQVQNNHAVDLKVARANSQHFATTPLVPGFSAKWSAEIRCAFDWSCGVGNLLQPIRSTAQIWKVMRHQYGISALVSQTSFCPEASGGVLKCWLFSRASYRSNAWSLCTWMFKNSFSQWSFCFLFSSSAKNLQDCPVLWNF